MKILEGYVKDKYCPKASMMKILKRYVKNQYGQESFL